MKLTEAPQHICCECKHFEETDAPFGSCRRWFVGYADEDLKLNECQVEGDEGWGIIVGPEFGCVLWEAIGRRALADGGRT